MDRTEIDLKQVELEKELQQYLSDRNIVKQAKMELDKKALEIKRNFNKQKRELLDKFDRDISSIESEISTLSQSIAMANYNISRVRSEIEVLKTQKWMSN